MTSQESVELTARGLDIATRSNTIERQMFIRFLEEHYGKELAADWKNWFAEVGVIREPTTLGKTISLVSALLKFSLKIADKVGEAFFSVLEDIVNTFPMDQAAVKSQAWIANHLLLNPHLDGKRAEFVDVLKLYGHQESATMYERLFKAEEQSRGTAKEPEMKETIRENIREVVNEVQTEKAEKEIRESLVSDLVDLYRNLDYKDSLSMLSERVIKNKENVALRENFIGMVSDFSSEHLAKVVREIFADYETGKLTRNFVDELHHRCGHTQQQERVRVM